VGAIGCPTTSTATLAAASCVPTTGWTALTGSTTNCTNSSAYQVFASTQSGAKVAWTLGATSPVGIVAIALAPAAAAAVTPPRTLVISQASKRAANY
jgi:NADPH:quinone reductase-like Zn-dependent oxidoreductase